ncbi:DUF1187 family protein [Pluralibacter gergoviae]
MYRITSTVIKPGNTPSQWTRYSKEKMTRKQCEKLLYKPKEVGRSFGDKVRLEGFRCEWVKGRMA